MSSLSATPPYLRRVNAALALREVPDPEAALQQLAQAREAAPDDATVELLLGMTYQDLGNAGEAEAHLRRAITLAPDMPDALKELGTLLLLQSRFAEAVDVLQRVVDGSNPTSSAVAALATALRKSGRTTDAIRALVVATAGAFNNDASLWALLGRYQLEQNKIEDATTALDRASKLDGTLDTLNDLAGAYALQDRLQDAIGILRDLAVRFPQSDRVARSLSHCHLRMGDLQAAMREADRAIALNTQHFRNWQARADALLALGKTDEAMGVIEKGIALARKTPEGMPVIERWLQQRIRLLLARNDLDAVFAQLDQDAADFGPNPVIGVLTFSVAFQFGRFDRALQSLEALQAMGVPVSPWDRYSTLHGLSQPDQALRAVVPSGEPSREVLEKLRGMMGKQGGRLYAIGAYPAARSVFQQAYDLDPADARGANNLAFVLLCDGNWVEAERYLDQALKAESGIKATARANFGYAQLRQGRYVEAIETLNLVKSGEPPTGAPDPAILHVGCLRKGAFLDEPADRYPQTAVPVALAALANCATAMLLNGDADDAISVAKRACEVDKNNAAAYCVLGCLLAETGQTEAARDAWERFKAVAETDSARHRASDLLSGLER